MNQPAPRERPGKRQALGPLLQSPRYEILPLPTALRETAELPAGTTVTVTSSPRRGLESTVEVAEQLAAQGMRAVPHIAARQVRARGELTGLLDRLEAAGIDEVFVVAGDAREPLGPYPDGLSLLRAMDDLGRVPARVGVPGYPEGHWAIDAVDLWLSLQAKQRYASYVVTQLCFDVDAICRFAVDMNRRGIELPVIAGVPGVVDAGKLLRVSLRVGVGESVRFVRGHRSVAGRLLRPGGYRPEPLVRKLAARVAAGRCELAGLHLYTFNRVEATARWVDQAYRRAA